MITKKDLKELEFVRINGFMWHYEICQDGDRITIVFLTDVQEAFLDTVNDVAYNNSSDTTTHLKGVKTKQDLKTLIKFIAG